MPHESFISSGFCGFCPVLFFEKLPSTMDKAHDLAAQGAVEKTLVLARTQTKGRGRRGKFWKSPEGNLYMSVILRPQEPLKN